MLDWRRRSGKRLEGAKCGATEDVFFELLLHIGTLDGFSPVERSEIDHLLDWPGRQEAEQVAEVTERLEPVHFTAGEQRDNRGIDFAALVIPDKSQLRLPKASRRNAFSETLLWMGSRPSSRRRWRASRWLRA